LRLVVAVMLLALLVLVIESARVRGRVGRLETTGAPALAAATHDPLGSPQSFNLVLKEMEVVPKFVEVPAGTPLTLNVVNEGQTPHNLALHGGPKTPDLKTGQKATPEVGTVARAMTGECSIPGHKEAGMTFEVRVSGAAAAAASAEQADAASDDTAKLDPNATPPAAWQPYNPKLAPAPGGREHKLTLTATEGVLEVAPGGQAAGLELRRPGPRPGAAGEGRRPGRATRAGAGLGAGRRTVGAGVLDLQPAQGGFVEFGFDEPGPYPIVSHKFANVAKGALGLFQAGDVKAADGGR
jgi:Cupredoxin-like domain